MLQTSQGSRKPMKIIEVKIVIKKVARGNTLNFFFKSENIPILWKKLYSKISYDKYYKHNQDCREKHFFII